MNPKRFSDEQREANRKASAAKFKESNPNYFKEKQALYYQKNKARIRAQQQQYRKKNAKKTGAANNEQLREVV
jgi:hypothetical protein